MTRHIFRNANQTRIVGEEEIPYTPEPLCGTQQRSANPNHVVHYPLCGLDLDFQRYHHRRLGPADIMVHNIVQDLLFPKRVKPSIYARKVLGFPHKVYSMIKQQDKALGLDIKVLDDMLRTEAIGQNGKLGLGLLTGNEHHNCEAILGVIQRYYMENLNPAFSQWLLDETVKASEPHHTAVRGTRRKRSIPLGGDEARHLKSYSSARTTQQKLQVYSGPNSMLVSGRPIRTTSDRAHLDDPPMHPQGDVYIRPPEYWFPEARHNYDAAFKLNSSGLGRPRLTRSQSLPPPGTREYAALQDYAPDYWRSISFPRLSLREIDRRSRRRSLSRRHIVDMFVDRPSTVQRLNIDSIVGEICPIHIDLIDFPRSDTTATCENCGLPFHDIAHCISRCGRCGTEIHYEGIRPNVLECKVPKSSTCKCAPVPNFHQIDDCRIKCSRRCGNPYPPGHFRHRNAMLCKARCCMCGVFGHCGKDCRQKQCGCGGAHLGQDCGWKPTCRAKGCPRYHCKKHCRECGKQGEGPFVGGYCEPCLKNSEPVAPGVESGHRPQKKARMRWGDIQHVELQAMLQMLRYRGNPPPMILVVPTHHRDPRLNEGGNPLFKSIIHVDDTGLVVDDVRNMRLALDKFLELVAEEQQVWENQGEEA